MPSGVVDSPRDEHKWQKAKSIAEKQGRGGNYAYIMGIYKKMKPSHRFEKSALFKVAQTNGGNGGGNGSGGNGGTTNGASENGDSETQEGNGKIEPKSASPWPRFYWGRTEGRRRICQPWENPERDSCRRKK